MSRWRKMYYLDANVFIFPQIYDMKIDCATRGKEYLAALAEKEISQFMNRLHVRGEPYGIDV